MSDKDLLYQVKDTVAYFTINREKQRNAISGEIVELFLKFLDQAEKDPGVRVILLTGAGEKAFCAGMDLGATSGRGKQQKEEGALQYARLLKRLAVFPKPTVAKVNGYCLAGGMGFMLACDIVIARDDAQFGAPEVNVGLWPMMIGALIFRNVLKKKAMEMILLGEKLTAGQAENIGLITKTVPAIDLDKTIQKVLDTLSLKSPIGVKMGKEAFHRASNMSLEDSLDYLATMLVEVMDTEDAQEGIKAFIEKRNPRFTGR